MEYGSPPSGGAFVSKSWAPLPYYVADTGVVACRIGAILKAWLKK